MKSRIGGYCVKYGTPFEFSWPGIAAIPEAGVLKYLVSKQISSGWSIDALISSLPPHVSATVCCILLSHATFYFSIVICNYRLLLESFFVAVICVSTVATWQGPEYWFLRCYTHRLDFQSFSVWLPVFAWLY